MINGASEMLNDDSSVKMINSKQQQSVHQQQQNVRKSVGVMGSRRIFAPAFKLKVLDSYRNDIDCRGNQRATARKYGIHRRQIQKWLQCEGNLRNSCVENGNTAVSSTTTNSSMVVSKPDSNVTETARSAVTPVTPALNLSLARLHGDELTTQQGPPPHPPHGSSPSLSQCNLQTTNTGALLSHIASVNYQEYSSTSEQHLCRKLEQREQTTETQIDQERNYYVLDRNGEDNVETTSVFDDKVEIKIYQTLTNYRLSSHQEYRYNANDTCRRVYHKTPNHCLQQREQNYNSDVESPDKKSYGLLLAPSAIKTERTSPDLVATPGPYESGVPRTNGSKASLSPISCQTTNINDVNSSSTSTSSVHFGSPQSSTSPSLHVHVHEQLHEHPALVSEKSMLSFLPQDERESRMMTKEIEEKRKEGVRYLKAVIKKEMHVNEEETNDGEEGAISSCTDYQRPLVDGSSLSSDPLSPDCGNYSLTPSPHHPASSLRSNSSYSDSESDPLDCSSSSQNSSGDLIRRRSFSLRFKLDVLDAFRRDVGVAGNQRATARKFGINRRQVQKWLGQETELRGEIALRGNSRQRLGPIQDNVASDESPVDLRTTNYVPMLSPNHTEIHYEQSPPPFYCCNVNSVVTQRHAYYQHPVTEEVSPEIESIGSCNLPYCVNNQTTYCYQEPLHGSCYTGSQDRLYCYSPRDYSEISSLHDTCEEISPPKRQLCTLSCCYGMSPPKKMCLDLDNSRRTDYYQYLPPQDTPLCLVKPKRLFQGSISQMEPVTSTVPTPPSSDAASPSPTNKDLILFKPYLDNPVSKPTKEYTIQCGLSTVNRQSLINNNNNNRQNTCNLNENRSHNYNLQLSLQLPVSWTSHSVPYIEFPQVKSAFFRYPTRYA